MIDLGSEQEPPFTRDNIFMALHEAAAPVEVQEFVMGALDSWRESNEADNVRFLPHIQELTECLAVFLNNITGENRKVARQQAIVTSRDFLLYCREGLRPAAFDAHRGRMAAAKSYVYLGTLEPAHELDLMPLEAAEVSEESLIELFRQDFWVMNPAIESRWMVNELRSINGDPADPHDDFAEARGGLTGFMTGRDVEAQIMTPLYKSLATSLAKRGIVVTKVDEKQLWADIEADSRRRHLGFLNHLPAGDSSLQMPPESV